MFNILWPSPGDELSRPGAILWICLAVTAMVTFVLPTFLGRKKSNAVAICVLNLLSGLPVLNVLTTPEDAGFLVLFHLMLFPLSLICWGAALVWSLTKDAEVRD